MTEASIPAQPTAAPAPKRKAGVPVWRVGKPDSFLAAAVDTARAALADIARPEDIGEHLAVKSEGERVATHLFASRLPGYRGWQWYATLARIARSKVATVSEIGLVPSEDAVLAPEWVPWSERVRPEERAAEQPAAEQPAAEQPAAEQQAASEESMAHDGEGGPSEGGAPESSEQSEASEQPEASAQPQPDAAS